MNSFQLLNLLAVSTVLLASGLSLVRVARWLGRSVLRVCSANRLYLYIYLLLLYALFNVPAALTSSKSSNEIQAIIQSPLFPTGNAVNKSRTGGLDRRPRTVSTITLASTIRDAIFLSAADKKGALVAVGSDERFVCRPKTGNATLTQSRLEEVLQAVDFKGWVAHEKDKDKEKDRSDFFSSYFSAAFLSILTGEPPPSPVHFLAPSSSLSSSSFF